MVDDGSESARGKHPAPLVPQPERRVILKMYRVSWLVDGKRRERFFAARSWAEKYVNVLLDCADTLQTKVDPMIGEIEFHGEE